MKKKKKANDDRFTISSLKNKVFEEFRFICEEYEIDIKTLSPLQFGFVVGELNTRIIKPNDYLIFDSNKQYNANNLYRIYKYILKPLCNLYNQVANDIYFCLFFDIELVNLEYIYIIYGDMRRTSFREILSACEQIDLKNLLIEKRVNPVGIVTILNKQYGWGTPDNVRKAETTQEISVNTLPQIGQKD